MRSKKRARQLELEEAAPEETRRRFPRRRTLRRRFPAIAGDVIPARVKGGTGVVLGDVVQPRCRARVGRAWLCLSCGQYLVNETQRDFHCEAGAHVLARVCMQHGAEVPGRREL